MCLFDFKDVPMTGGKKADMATSSFVSMRRQSFLRAAEAPASISGVAKEYLGWEKVIAAGGSGWVLVGLGCHPRVGLGGSGTFL